MKYWCNKCHRGILKRETPYCENCCIENYNKLKRSVAKNNNKKSMFYNQIADPETTEEKTEENTEEKEETPEEGGEKETTTE